MRIDFQPYPYPYPYPSYMARLVLALQETQVEGDTAFLRKLTPDSAARDLVDEGLVREALAQMGGPRAFGQPENLQRQEVIEP